MNQEYGFESLAGIFTSQWKYDVLTRMNITLATVKKSTTLNHLETIITAYIGMLYKGGYEVPQWQTPPQGTEWEVTMGLPSQDTALLIKYLAINTGSDQLVIQTFVDSLYFFYKRGKVPMEVFDPKGFDAVKKSSSGASATQGFVTKLLDSSGVSTTGNVVKAGGIIFVLGALAMAYFAVKISKFAR